MIRISRLLIVAGFMVAWMSASQAADKYFVVKVTDFSKEHEYKAVSQEELKVLEKEIADEARLWTKIVQLSAKEWDSNQQTKGKAFPQGAISKRTLSVKGQPFPDQGKAQERVDKYVNDEEEKAKKDAERDAERAKTSGKKPEKKSEKDIEKENFNTMGRAMFETKLKEVREAEKAPKEEPAAK
ncbi:MAG: hypothetical protein A2498_07590 [Lentisphaerae bacterium RIFOXYC12_FULL_60_16]|nr:MAG: hypothetical protein A2498_07590 [Lentisphaerae bacterium RIFOXYC12_FULL_60_16]OGV76816.1 MAG: hypothetical protein A2340_08130 [Lentisphaerae bacterium RIFOXYB12_FULL_60_10]